MSSYGDWAALSDVCDKETARLLAVSYTHLDVYKRQVQETALKAELGRAISLIPGKSESSLMIQFSDCCRLWFGGENEGP